MYTYKIMLKAINGPSCECVKKTHMELNTFMDWLCKEDRITATDPKHPEISVIVNLNLAPFFAVTLIEEGD